MYGQRSILLDDGRRTSNSGKLHTGTHGQNLTLTTIPLLRARFDIVVGSDVCRRVLMMFHYWWHHFDLFFRCSRCYHQPKSYDKFHVTSVMAVTAIDVFSRQQHITTQSSQVVR